MLKYGMKDVVYLVFLWCFFGFVHSITISHFFKETLIKFTGKIFETYFYRIIYNLISLVIYLNIVYFVKNSTETFLLPPPLIYIFTIISLTGFLIAVIAFFQTDVLEFLGIKQVWRFFTKGKRKSKKLFGYDKLVANGMFQFVRHPMYFGVSLVFLFNPYISTLTLTDRICAVSYLIIGSFFEEKRMLMVFGIQYKLYKESVPRFLPYKFTHSPGHKDINSP
jgi:protein-S-isoprenylcysteine O-methyltransferase Ste14